MATLGAIVFDVIEQEQPSLTNTVTDKPVENGTDISDHIRKQPLKMSVIAIFSGNEAMDKYDELLSMINSEELYTYSGGLGTYTNLVIENISPMKDASYGDGYECSISLKQVRIVEFETVEITLGVDPETGEQIQGDTSSSEIDEKTSEKEEIGEESADRTSLQIFYDLIFGGDE